MGGWNQNGSYEDWMGGLEWIQLAHDRDLSWVRQNGDEPSDSDAA
jgi:hypothetical protein